VNVGLDIVGDVPNTRLPVPVSSVTAAAKLALMGVWRKFVIPDPNAPPLKLGITNCFVNVILEPAFRLLSAALSAKTDDVAFVIAIIIKIFIVKFLNA
jgi:hypothetical protein